MDLPPSRITTKESLNKTSIETPNMATLTMRNSSSALPSPQEIMQEGSYGQYSNIPLRSRPSRERIALPSIRQAVPEIELSNPGPERSKYPTDLLSYSPDLSEHNPLDALNKRRRMAAQERRATDPRDYSVPGIFSSPRQGRAQSVTSPTIERQSNIYPMRESWSASNRESPYQTSTLPALRSPRFESPNSEFRPTLPSLPSLTLERGGSVPRGPGNWSEYVLNSSRSSTQSNLSHSSSSFSPPHPTSTPAHNLDYFGYEPQGQSSLSGLGIHSHSHSQISERSPYPSRSYYPERPEVSEASGMEATKHRKRRGNLPKETTDKLRAWFVAHLHHPYPTEDEKQELMRQTKLQMNQISNWFINARRRQLPAMINNARVESDARSAQANESSAKAEDRGGGDAGAKGRLMDFGLILESESEGGEDDFDPLERVRSESSSSLAT